MMKPTQLRAWIRKYGDWGHLVAGLYLGVNYLRKNWRASLAACAAFTALVVVGLWFWQARAKPRQVVGHQLRIGANKRQTKPELTLKRWKLAFVRAGSIWIANGDGTNQRKLIANADAPCWSLDKTQIVFARQGDVWIARADGTRQRRLTHRWNWSPAEMQSARGYEGGRDIDISWGRADNLIDFSHWEQFRVVRNGSKTGRLVQSCSIYEVPADKPTDEELEPRFDIFDDEARFHASVNSHPAWSRDGNQLAFVRNGDIWIAKRVDYHKGDPTWKWTHRTSSSWGWDVTRLAAVASYDAPTWHGSRQNAFVTHLSWSPDGKSLVYNQRRINGSGYRDIQLLRISGSKDEMDVQRVSCDLDGGEDPCFSPDGRFIAYYGGIEGKYAWGILSQTIDGKTIIPLIKDGEQPAW